MDQDLHFQYENCIPFAFLLLAFCLLMHQKTILFNSLNIPESVATAIASQQKQPDFLARVVLDRSTALDYLVTEQRGVYAIADTPTVIGSTPLVLQQIQEINKQATWLKQMDSPAGTFLDLFDTNWFD